MAPPNCARIQKILVVVAYVVGLLPHLFSHSRIQKTGWNDATGHSNVSVIRGAQPRVKY